MRRFATCLPALLILAICSSASAQAIDPAETMPLVDWQDAHKYMDQQVVVQGKIVQTKDIKTITFLNFDAARTFTAIIRKDNYGKFPKPPVDLYLLKTVQIRGRISQYRGSVQIEVHEPDQITILDEPESVPEPPAEVKHEFKGTLRVATFNILNLFDDKDDPYHDDEGTPPKPRDEMEKVAAKIREVNADVLALQEIENRGYLQLFNDAMLRDLGYEHVVCIESNDARGIDCAILSRLPVGPVTSYRHLRLENGADAEQHMRRDLLQAEIRPPNCPPVQMFVVHLKSKRGGSETEAYRIQEAKLARDVMDGLLAKDRDAMFLICGDFNDTFESEPVKTIVGEGRSKLTDFLSDVSKDAVTYNKGRLSMIDYIFASPALAKRYVAKSYKIYPGSVETSGSDHNPVVAEFKLRD